MYHVSAQGVDESMTNYIIIIIIIIKTHTIEWISMLN